MISSKKAENVRSVIRYLQKFKNALVVIYLDDKTIESPLFSSHIRDIAFLHQAGLKVVIIPGARSRIDEVLRTNNIIWTYHENIRIASAQAMPLIKMAAFDVSNTIMTSLAANSITAVIGNWVRARSKGIIDGFDYGTAGEIDRLDSESLQTVLDDGFIPIFPCIGWNTVGHPYNISSTCLAQQVAIALKADKLFYVMENGGLNAKDFDLTGDDDIDGTFLFDGGITISENGKIAALDLNQADNFIKQKKNLDMLELAVNACRQGVTRVHFVDGNLDGVLLTEIFSDFGSGTMIYTNNYGKIRPMVQTDIPSVLAVMRPFIQSGKLLPRTQAELTTALADFIVYELDGGVHACAALHLYDDGQAEIAAVAVDEAYNHMGIGPKMIETLIDRAKSANAKSIFIMTTQAIDWFEKLGFTEDKIESLPEERRAKWSPDRNSKVYRLN
ncbi:MAG: amino-acid N-acetyltransferase [Treponema sp.]|nr:amino-acid N-acetyltransferase [Treponema sp.]